MRIPRIVVAAPSSRAGKTTVATGLMAALSARGLAVSPHKVGPDYIDPGYHAVATGRPGRNLDAFLVGEHRVGPLFAHGARGADVAVIEGVMGLFDGRGATDEASTAHVARLLDAPVLLVVDASAQSASVAALVHGFGTFDPRVQLAGVILNRVGSPRHEQILRQALASCRLPVLGALPRQPEVHVPSRHLGLIPAAERSTAARAAVAALGALIEATCDVDRILATAGAARPLTTTPWDAAAAVGGPAGRRVTVAVAGGPAFTFSYAETAELLTAAGADVVTVDPIRDEQLPAGTGALVLGGGFPEEHAADLSANAALRGEIQRLAGSGAPIVAECAGMLYLADDLDGRPMCGVLPTRARMTKRLTLGYREARAADGSAVRAHEFHRTECEPAAGERPAYLLADGKREGFVRGSVHASYLHRHWAGAPQLAGELVAAAL